MLDVGASSQQEFDQATNAARTAEAQLKALDDQIRQQKAELAYYQVRAPIDGVVGDIPVRVGDRVSKTTELTNIDDNTRPRDLHQRAGPAGEQTAHRPAGEHRGRDRSDDR